MCFGSCRTSLQVCSSLLQSQFDNTSSNLNTARIVFFRLITFPEEKKTEKEDIHIIHEHGKEVRCVDYYDSAFRGVQGLLLSKSQRAPS